MDNRNTYIYALIDPRDNSVNYIGKTVNMENRYLGHMSSKKFGSKNLWEWFDSLEGDGLKPSMEVIEIVEPGGNWKKREHKWISYYRRLGSPLKNRIDNWFHCDPGTSLSTMSFKVDNDMKTNLDKWSKEHDLARTEFMWYLMDWCMENKCDVDQYIKSKLDEWFVNNCP